MGEVLKVQDLPVDCLLIIQSFLIGKPEHIRIKRNNLFTLFQLRCRFRHHVYNTKVEYDYINGGKLCGLYREYRIMSALYTVKTILKEHDRFEVFFLETFRELLNHKDFNLNEQSYIARWQVQLHTRKHVYYSSTVAYDEDETLEDYLKETVMTFEGSKINENDIEFIQFSAMFEIQ